MALKTSFQTASKIFSANIMLLSIDGNLGSIALVNIKITENATQ